MKPSSDISGINNENTNRMNLAEITKQIREFSKTEKVDFLKACSAFQSAAAKLQNEKLISVIHEIKVNSPEYKQIFA